MSPLYQLGEFGYPTAMALATLLGIGFGFVLERSGFGRASVLVSQFYGDDMRVLKVMFSGLVTTMIGLGILGELGLVDLTLIRIPETWILPAILGGTILGIGFVVSGYCPGTALVAMGSGHLDGVLALVGIMLGSLVFGYLYDPLEALYLSTGHGKLTFVDLLGIGWPILALIVTVMAILAFIGGEKVEKIYAPKHDRVPPQNSVAVRNRVFVGFVVAALVGVATLALPDAEVEAAAAPPPMIEIEVLEVARHLTMGHEDLYLVDLRSPDACAASRIPGAMCLSEDDLDAAFIADLVPTRTLVLYGETNVEELPPSAAEFEGAVRVLGGGAAAWRATIETQPTAPAEPTAEAVARYNELSTLHGYFTGSQAAAAPIRARPTVVRRTAPRGGGC